MCFLTLLTLATKVAANFVLPEAKRRNERPATRPFSMSFACFEVRVSG
jgi:hypothetical protein